MFVSRARKLRRMSSSAEEQPRYRMVSNAELFKTMGYTPNMKVVN